MNPKEAAIKLSEKIGRPIGRGKIVELHQRGFLPGANLSPGRKRKLLDFSESDLSECLVRLRQNEQKKKPAATMPPVKLDPLVRC